MAGGWPLGSNLSVAADVGTVLTGAVNILGGVTLTTGATNTKGSYSQLIASTAKDTQWMMVAFQDFPCTGNELSIDIAIGGAGSEVVIIADILVNDQQVLLNFPFFPVCIPAGTRIAARAQSTSATDSIVVQVTVFDGAFEQSEGNCGVDTYGFLSASTHGTSTDPGGTANTKGAYVQLTASTTRDLAGFFVGQDILANSTAFTVGNIVNLLDVAIGGAGSEVVILPNLVFVQNRSSSPTNNTISPSFSPYFPIPIPSGTRIAVRVQSSTNTATVRLIGATLYGARK